MGKERGDRACNHDFQRCTFDSSGGLALIFNEMGKAVAAISLSGPAFRVTKKIIQETLKKEVVETALKISQRLGFRGGKCN